MLGVGELVGKIYRRRIVYVAMVNRDPFGGIVAIEFRPLDPRPDREVKFLLLNTPGYRSLVGIGGELIAIAEQVVVVGVGFQRGYIVIRIVDRRAIRVGM